MVREQIRRPASGWGAVGILVPATLLAVPALIGGAAEGFPAIAIGGVLALAACGFGWAGLFVVNPNEAKVLQLFGEYVGSVRDAGFWWASPFFTKKRVSLRIISAEVGKLKVNDLDGNPVEIAAIVV